MTFDTSIVHIIFFIVETLCFIVTAIVSLDGDYIVDPIDLDAPDHWIVSAFMFLTGIIYEIINRNANGIIILAGFGFLLLLRIIPTIKEFVNKRKNNKRYLEIERFNNFRNNITYIIENSRDIENLLDEVTTSFLRRMQAHYNPSSSDFKSDSKGNQLAEFMDNTAMIMKHYKELVDLNIATDADVVSLRQSFELLTKSAIKYDTDMKKAFQKSIEDQEKSFKKL